MTILVLTTGGTIGALAYDDPRVPPKVSVMPEQGKDYVRDALADPRFNFADLRCVSLEQRDSKLIDTKYLENILNNLVKAPEKEILLTCGTDRILDVADYFHGQAKILHDKILMLTGAMIPLANGSASDGYSNLEFSIKQLSDFAKNRVSGGVYVVLCDYNDAGTWQPRLYPYEPGKYEKTYDAKDGSRNRIRERQ